MTRDELLYAIDTGRGLPPEMPIDAAVLTMLGIAVRRLENRRTGAPLAWRMWSVEHHAWVRMLKPCLYLEDAARLAEMFEASWGVTWDHERSMANAYARDDRMQGCAYGSSLAAALTRAIVMMAVAGPKREEKPPG